MAHTRVRFHPDVVTVYIRAPSTAEDNALQRFHAHARECVCCKSALNASRFNGDLLCTEGSQQADNVLRLLRWHRGRCCPIEESNVHCVVEVGHDLKLSLRLLRAVAHLRSIHPTARPRRAEYATSGEFYRSCWSRQLMSQETYSYRITQHHYIYEHQTRQRIEVQRCVQRIRRLP